MRRASHSRQKHSSRPPRHAAAAVELAVALPVLILLVLGCVDLGRVAAASTVLNQAVAAGMIRGATHQRGPLNSSDWEQAVHDAIEQELEQIPDFDAGDLDVEITCTTSVFNETVVTIEATYPFKMVVDYPGLPGKCMLRERVVSVTCR